MSYELWPPTVSYHCSLLAINSAAVVDGTVQNDARGAVFQWVDTVTGKGIAMNDDGTYKGNVVADMQVMVAKAIHDGVLNDTDALQTGVNTIDTSVVEWAANPALTFEPKYRCGGDVMHHVRWTKRESHCDFEDSLYSPCPFFCLSSCVR